MANAKEASAHLDFGTMIGITMAVAGIVGGLLLEKGSLRDIVQYTAAIIVLGGTFGAVLVTSPFSGIKSALAHLRVIFSERTTDPGLLVDTIIAFATKARKQGIISLEHDSYAVSDPFLRKALDLAVDGTSIEELKSIMELDIQQAEARADEAAKVYESGGGYSPTIGIIGAVLGLIQVMKNLEDVAEVGRGIAVAFVATVYGVALANIFLLPAAARIRSRAAAESKLHELALQGIIGIIEGSNPKIIRLKLQAYLPGASGGEERRGPSRIAA